LFPPFVLFLNKPKKWKGKTHIKEKEREEKGQPERKRRLSTLRESLYQCVRERKRKEESKKNALKKAPMSRKPA